MNKVEDKEFKDMLEQSNLPVRASYRPGEVCRLLGISPRTFWNLTERYELDPSTRLPRDPNSLDSYLLRSHRRVRYNELKSYFDRNSTYERRNSEDPRQLDLFD